MNASKLSTVERLAEELVARLTIQLEASGRHVHLSRADVETLFGAGYRLNRTKDLSQPGQFLSEEKVKLVGKKGTLQVSVLGPARSAAQVEVSITDKRTLGVEAPVRESGNLEGAGPKGVLKDIPAAIVAHNHIHVPTDIARKMNMKDGERVSVQMLTERMLTFDDVVIRVSDKYRYKMHIDFDEANAAMVSGFTLGKIIRH